MDDEVLDLLRRCAAAVATAFDGVADRRAAGGREGQYALDLVADAAASRVLDDAGVGVVSEESPPRRLDADVVVVVDPVDGSTNASRGVPYFATSLCAVDRDGMRAAVVANLATGVRYEAVRGRGAWCDGAPLRVTACDRLSEAFVVLSGEPRQGRPWGQVRLLGATALELCDVARGAFDAYLNTQLDVTAPWDYLGGLLVCQEAGAAIADAFGRDLVTFDERRVPLVAASPALLAQLRAYAWPDAG